jgi:hypothetical protein
MAHRQNIPNDEFDDEDDGLFSFVDQDTQAQDQTMFTDGGDELFPRHGNLMGFGQHRTLTFWEVSTPFPDYIEWARSQPRPGVALSRFFTWYNTYFDFINGESQYLGPQGRDGDDDVESTTSSAAAPSMAAGLSQAAGPRSTASSSSSVRGSTSVASSGLPGARRRTAKRIPPPRL